MLSDCYIQRSSYAIRGTVFRYYFHRENQQLLENNPKFQTHNNLNYKKHFC